MNELIKRNKIDDSKDDHKILQFLNDFKAQKCLYCFEENKQFLGQCKDCGYYFCNNIHRKTSHIIIHLRQCKHKKIALTPFEEDIKCDKCKNKDIFNLYFKGKFILCEECLEDKVNFKKIIENKRINTKILICPDIPPVANRIDSYSESLISRINHKINILKKITLPTVSLNYTKKKRYCLIYKTLIFNEKEEVERRNQMDEFFSFSLKFSCIDKSYIIAEIKKKEDDDQEFQFYPRQLLIVAKKTNENKSFLARVIDIDKTKSKITIYFKDLDKLLYDGEYLIKEKELTQSYDRMIDGLENLKQKKSDLFNKDIQLLIIGKEIKEGKENISNENNYIEKSQIPQKLNLAEFENVKLNKSQEKAIRNCFNNKLTLIRGPPGTGKSTVLAIMTYHLKKLKKKNDKILICAPSNRAVDNISFLLQKIKNINFVRVLSLEREIVEDVDTTNSLNELIQKEIEKTQKNRKINELFEKKKKYGVLKGEDYNSYNKLMGEYQTKILNSCDIILSTINNSYDQRLSNYNFPIVIIDEGTQALEPDCLLALYHKAQMVVIIGDEKQLGPVVISPNSSASGISISLFERLICYYDGSNFISTLTEQYRMHKFLYEFSNKKFYNGQMVTNKEIKLDENIMNNFPWPNKKIPTFFYHYDETEKMENNSYYNEREIFLIFGIVYKLIKAGVQVENLGIITPYNAQKFRLYDKFDDKKYDNLRIESVDGFQGMEKEYIIISTVRSNVYGNVGFLSSTKRLNVALTRAKKGLIILGNSECLSKKAGIWRDFINFYYSFGLIYKGRLSKLEKVDKKEILLKELNNEEEEGKENEEEDDEDEEIIFEKEEKHKNIKREIIFDYFKEWEIIKDSNDNENSDSNINPAPPIYNENRIKENDDNIKKNKNKKNKKSKNNNYESDEEEEEKEEKKENKKNKNKKNYKEEDEKEVDKKGKNNKNKISHKDNNKKNKKNSNDSNSDEDIDKNKRNKKDKKKIK